MRIILLVALLAGCGTVYVGPDSPTGSPDVQLWRGDTRKIAGRWVFPSLFARADGSELQVDLAIGVGSSDELNPKDIAVHLQASGTPLYCAATQPLGFTESKGITAQASIVCNNSGRALPTELVVELEGQRETFALQIASLTASHASR